MKRAQINYRFSESYVLAITVVLLFITSLGFSQGKKEVRITRYKNGNTQFLYTYVDDVLNGEFKGFYENGDLWSKGNYVDGQLEGEFLVYAKPDSLASIEIYKKGTLIRKTVFYQEYPDHTYKRISEKGYVCVEDGSTVTPDSTTPDGFIFSELDTVSYETIDYMWQKGKKVEFLFPQSDGTVVKIYSGKRAGVYVWKNGERIFVRKLNEEDQKELDFQDMQQLEQLIKSQ
jgi:hypothetical protein